MKSGKNSKLVAAKQGNFEMNIVPPLMIYVPELLFMCCKHNESIEADNFL